MQEKTESVFRITTLINVSYYNLPMDFSFPGESHDFWEVGYVDRGQVVMQRGDKSYLLKAGEMLFSKPNTFHTCRVWQDKPAAIVNLAFSMEGDLSENFQNEIISLGTVEKQCMATIVREAAQTYTHFDNEPAAVLMEKMQDAPYGSQQIICNRMEELMIYASRSRRNVPVESRLLLSDTLVSVEDMTKRLQEYLQTHYKEKLTLQSIAQFHGISVTKLKRLFRAETGGSVMSYLTGIRMKEAKRMIREKKLNFSQIAECIGYDSIHYFSTVFKKQTGMTLTEYSRSLRKN